MRLMINWLDFYRLENGKHVEILAFSCIKVFCSSSRIPGTSITGAVGDANVNSRPTPASPSKKAPRSDSPRFSFVHSPSGLIGEVRYPADENPHVVNIKKGMLGSLVSSQPPEVSHDFNR